MSDSTITKTKVVVRKKRRVVITNNETPPVEKKAKREPLKLKQRTSSAISAVKVKKKLSIKPETQPVMKKSPKCSTNKALRTLRERFPQAFNDDFKPLSPTFANDVFKLVSDVMSKQKLIHGIRAYQRNAQYMLNEATAGVVILDKEGNTVGEISPELAQQRMDRIKARAERGRMNEQKVLELLEPKAE